ncbi:uncharacterized protein WM277_025513 [Molossus nigricans]
MTAPQPPGLSCHRLPGRGSRCIEKSTRCAGRFNIHYLEDNQVVLLDTDYKNCMFVCVESTAAPEQSLACQYLARTPKLGEEAMEKFDRAMKLLPSHIQLLFTPTRAEGASAPLQRRHHPLLPGQRTQEGLTRGGCWTPLLPGPRHPWVPAWDLLLWAAPLSNKETHQPGCVPESFLAMGVHLLNYEGPQETCNQGSNGQRRLVPADP